MKVMTELEGDSRVCVARVEGDIDAFTAPDLKSALDGVVGQGCMNIVLDLSRVAYLDSSALGLIVWLNRILEPKGGRVVLAGASGDVTRILEISGLVGAAPTVSAAPNAEDAVAGLTLEPPQGPPLWTKDLQLVADPSSLSEMRSKVCAILEPLDLPESMQFDIKVAVGEALSNAVRHGSPRGVSDAIGVSVTAYPDRVSLVVTDCGAGFNGCTVSDGDPYAPSGRGVMFMRALMDDVQFVLLPQGGTAVSLVKHLGDAHPVD